MCDGTNLSNGRNVYGHLVCKKCWSRLANRRQLAYVVDLGLFYLLQVVLALGAGIFLALRIPDEATFAAAADDLTTVVWLVALLGLLVKDGLFQGRSPGKALFGLRVVEEKTGRHIGPVASLVPNLVLLIPVVPVVVAFQLKKGRRWGDGMAGTRVVWDRYRDRAPFALDSPQPAPEIPVG